MKNLLLCIALFVTVTLNAQTKKTTKSTKSNTASNKSVISDKQVSPNGLLYKCYKELEGPTAQEGNVIELNFRIVTEKDSILRNSFGENDPIITTVQASKFRGSFEEAMQMMSAGDSCSFWINADSMFAKSIRQPLPPFIRSGSFLRFDVKMYNVWTMQEYIAIRDAKMREANKEEDLNLAAYIKSNAIPATYFPESGLYYQQIKAGTGAKPVKGQTVSVHYTGKLIDGKTFDSSIPRNQTFEFQVGTGQVIEGWDMGLPLMHVGEKGILYIPSYRGYGERGAGASIPPYSILIFEIELIEIK
jgi:peptidylprolyl isomerase